MVKKKKAPRKKSAKKVKADDDSDVDGSDASAAPKRKAGGGFQKPFMLSPALSDLTGETQVWLPLYVPSLCHLSWTLHLPPRRGYPMTLRKQC